MYSFSDCFLQFVWPLYSSNLKREKTRADYLKVLSDFCEYIGKDILSFNESDAAYYADYLKERCPQELSIKTVENRLCVLRTFSAFILKMRSEIYEDWHVTIEFYSNPFDNIYIERPEGYYDLDSLPSISEIDKLLALSKGTSTMDFLIFSLIIRCGLSIGEVLKLSFSDFVCDSNGTYALNVTSVGGVIRRIKIGEDIVSIMSNYVSEGGRGNLGSCGGKLFVNKSGQVYSLRTIERHLKSYTQALLSNDMIKHDFTLQDMRNAAINLMLAGGANPLDVSKYVGTSDKWMFRYEGVFDEVLDAGDFSIISINF